jgi:HlyD family secretion protein
MSKTGWIVVAAVVGLAAGGAVVLQKERKHEPKFRTATVDRGDVVATVTASGSLSAVTTVKVGSQVSGIIAKLHADFNSVVKKGQLLAELDPTPFQATVDQRRADLAKAQVDLRNTEITLARDRNLFKQQLLAQSELDAAQTARDGAAAQVAQAQAGLKMAQANLEYTKITSPIDGTVVDRQYDVGQTVAASFQAPTLFAIAQDLTKMQVLTNIDEADIGRVKVGQEAVFSVDAFPDRTFRGAVSQIRLAQQIVQNVVTYPVMLDVANPDLKLMPGMTANVNIPVDRRTSTLRVPNAALRFRPADEDLEPEARAEKKQQAALGTPTPAPAPTPETAAAQETPGPRPTRGPGERPSRSGAGGERRWAGGGGAGGTGGAWQGRAGPRAGARGGVVYILMPEEKLKPAKLKTSITDGNNTAIESDGLHEGDRVVIGLATARAGDGSTSRPPGMGGGRGPRF